MRLLWPQTGESIVKFSKSSDHKSRRVEFDKETNISANEAAKASNNIICCRFFLEIHYYVGCVLGLSFMSINYSSLLETYSLKQRYPLDSFLENIYLKINRIKFEALFSSLFLFLCCLNLHSPTDDLSSNFGKS